MSGNLNSFRANLNASFDNLGDKQFNALYEEVLKQKAKRLIGEEAPNTGMSWREVSLTADIRLSNGHCHVVAQTWNLTHKDLGVDVNGTYQYSDEHFVVRGFDYPYPHPVVVIPEGTAIPASGSLSFRGWDE